MLSQSNMMRMVLRYPLRPGILYQSSRRPALPLLTDASSQLCYRRETYIGDGKTFVQRSWVDPQLVRKRPSRKPKKIVKVKEGSPLDYTSREGIAHILGQEIQDWRGHEPLIRKICHWGLRGDVMKAILISKDRDHPQKDGSPYTVMMALIELWSDEALASLQSSTATSSSTAFDMDNARNGLAAEGIGCIKRLVMNSFLRWLESQLKMQPLGSRLLARTQNLLSLVDLRFPSLKYGMARSMVRHIHLHVGPTNSGKTHGALLALCKANTGLYAGPLRLLAHEVWERIRMGTVSPGVSARECNLITGEEVKMAEGLAGLSACTVEMVNYNTMIDVAVIDEIQMIADPQRGSAWTTAVLGLPAKELHLCGENSVIPLIEKMAEACGDVLHIHNYKRLTPLKIGPSLGGDFTQIQKGDCVVAFSRSEIFGLKEKIEAVTPFKCALAYGALPPETKSEQARKFNDPDNDVSVMVASDAIGMGLNLKIKRIIFSQVTKWNGTEMVPISTSQLKQIAGRAGRYGTNKEDAAGGLATTLHHVDLSTLEAALEAPLKPITRAGIQPASEVLAALSAMLPDKKKHDDNERGRGRDLMTLYSDLGILSQIDSRIYFAGSYDQQFTVAPLLEDMVSAFRFMTIEDRELFAFAPANHRDERMMALLSNMVNYYARGDLIKFEDVDCLDMLETLQSVENVAKDFRAENEGREAKDRISITSFFEHSYRRFNIDDLMILESLHRGLTLYLWLSYRRGVVFCYRREVEEYSRRTEVAIGFCLEAVKAARRIRMANREKDGQKRPLERRSFGRNEKPYVKKSFNGQGTGRFQREDRERDQYREKRVDFFPRNNQEDAEKSAFHSS